MASNELKIPFVYAGEVVSAAVVLPLLGMTVVGLRFWQRSSKRHKIGVDDWMILLALFPVVGMSICLIYGTAKHAIGYKSPPYPIQLASPKLTEFNETTPEQTIVFKMDWIIWILMIPANGLIKLSALVMYRRIFVIIKYSAFDICTIAMIVVCSLWTSGFWLAQIFGCGSGFYKPFGPLRDVASCDTNTRLSALMITDLITDILVWCLPIPVVWSLNMSIIRRLGIVGVMSMAALSLAAAIIRLIVQLEITGHGYFATADVNLTLTILLYWSLLESSIGLVASCLPTLHAMTKRHAIDHTISSLRRLFGSTTTTATSSGHNSRTMGLYLEDSKRPDPEGNPTNRNHYGSSELSRGGSRASDVESGKVSSEGKVYEVGL
ncbi:hypothetical protein MMC25_002280 [Agyrium rufum]|nr:hypothetical protein [Agyrium rufum]